MPKLLIIDDEPEILDMIRSHFSLRGYEVVVAPDGALGLGLVEKERPDVILLDLKMKERDGDQFLRELRERDRKTKVIVITGFQDERVRQKVESLGIDGFLEKPASILEVERRVSELVK
jgi:DNA-binding response OmpR family regulator